MQAVKVMLIPVVVAVVMIAVFIATGWSPS